MIKFAKRLYHHGIKESEVIHEVYILERNNKNLFSKFIESIPSNMKGEKIKLLTNLIKIIKGEETTLPPQKYKQLKRNNKDKYIDYELKTKHLRLYFFKENNNRIIVLGGFKKDEAQNIEKFRNIKKEYFKSCTPKKS